VAEGATFSDRLLASTVLVCAALLGWRLFT